MNTQLNISQEEFETIERYIREEMSREEAVAFSDAMDKSEELRLKHLHINKLITGIQEHNLRYRLNEFHLPFEASKKNSKPLNGRVFSIKHWTAIAAILITALVSTWFLLNRQSQPDALYAKHYRPDPGLISEMGSTEDYLFEKAMVEYKNENYTDAINTWSSLAKENPGSDTLQYFLGSAHLAINETGKALNYLKTVAENTTSFFFKDANWYTGLALIKLNKESEAIPFIERSEYPQAAELIKKIKD